MTWLRYTICMANVVLTRSDIERIVIKCVSETLAVEIGRVTSSTDVVFDLGTAGDDGTDLIHAVCAATGANLQQYDFYRHFGPEAAFSMHSGEPLTVSELSDLVETSLDDIHRP